MKENKFKKNKINESIVDTIIDVIRYNMIINDIGTAVVFEIELPFSRTKIDIRIRKNTLSKLFDFIDNLKKNVKLDNEG